MIYQNFSLISNSQNDNNNYMIRTHISFYDDKNKKETISKEKERKTFEKIIGMSVKHHKLKSLDYNTLFCHKKLKSIPSKVKLTQFQIYENTRKLMFNKKDKIWNNHFRILSLPSKIIKKENKIKKKQLMFSLFDKNENIDNKNNDLNKKDINNKIFKKVKSTSFNHFKLPKLNIFNDLSYNKFNNNILKLKKITKNLQLEYTRLHFKK